MTRSCPIRRGEARAVRRDRRSPWLPQIPKGNNGKRIILAIALVALARSNHRSSHSAWVSPTPAPSSTAHRDCTAGAPRSHRLRINWISSVEFKREQRRTPNALRGLLHNAAANNVCVYFANPAALTLTGNGSATSAPITTAQTVVYAGKYTNALPNATVGLKVFHGLDCTTGQGFYTDPSYTTTDASGNYSKESGTPPGAGLYSARTNVGSTLSNCINIPVTEVPAVDELRERQR